MHILIAEAFLPPRPGPNYNVNHKDGVKTNSVRSNLEWLTQGDNIRHAIERGLFTPRISQACRASCRVKIVGQCQVTGRKKTFDSIADAVEHCAGHRRANALDYVVRVNGCKYGYRWSTV